MIPEHAHVVLTRDLPEHGLKAGDVGVVVHVHRSSTVATPIGYMIEIFTVDGASVDEVSVPADALRQATPMDRVHARPVAAE